MLSAWYLNLQRDVMRKWANFEGETMSSYSTDEIKKASEGGPISGDTLLARLEAKRRRKYVRVAPGDLIRTRFTGDYDPSFGIIRPMDKNHPAWVCYFKQNDHDNIPFATHNIINDQMDASFDEGATWHPIDPDNPYKPVVVMDEAACYELANCLYDQNSSIKCLVNTHITEWVQRKVKGE